MHWDMSAFAWWTGWGLAAYGLGYWRGRARGMTATMLRLAQWLPVDLLKQVRECIRAHER
jgi:hypothetical protein